MKLRIYGVLLELVVAVRPLLRELERRDADLARQWLTWGRTPLREGLACFQAAAALGNLPDLDEVVRDRFDHGLGALVRLAGDHRRRTLTRARLGWEF